MKNIIEEYCKEQSYKLAQKIDEKMALIIKPRPKYCPEWLYKKIIKDSIVVINNK